MNIFQKIGNAFSGTKAYYAPGVTMLLGSTFGWNYKSKSGQLTKGYENKIVYAVVNVLVRKLIEAPLIVSKVVSEKDLARVKSYNFAKGNDTGQYNIRLLKALEELQDHKMIDLLNNPNEYQTGVELRESFWFNYQLTGDGFLFVERGSNGPVFLHSLPADRVTIKREGDDWRLPITGYSFNTYDGKTVQLPFEDVMHLAKWSPNDPKSGGYSPMQAVGSAIAKNDQNDLAQGAMFKNGGTAHIISSETVVENGKAHFKLDKTQVDSIKDTLASEWTGAVNNGKWHVTNGTVKVDKIGDSLIDMNAIAADDQDAVRIAAGWGVNSILIGDKSGGTENNVKVAEKQLVTNVVVSELRKFDMKFKAFSKKWYKGERLDVSHDLTEFAELAPDLALMKATYGDAWYITGNEKRKLFAYDEDPDPNMNKFLVPVGLQPLENVFADPFAEIPSPVNSPKSL